MDSLIASFAPELRNFRKFSLFPNFKDVEIYSEISKIIGPTWLVDRTQNITLPFKTCLTDENIIPNFSSLPKLDFLESVLARCNELINTNKKIYLLWSGGVDSTMVLTAFLLANVSPNQLVIVCNNDSIREYPNFYLNYIRGKFEVQAAELVFQNLKLKTVDGIILSCEQGDCMHGQDFGMMGFLLFGKTYLWSKPNKENILKLFKAKGLSDQAANCWHDIYVSNIDQSPREINTMYDFCWWTTFNWRWQWAIEKLRMRFNSDQGIQTFFSNDQMQYWSVNHKQHDILSLSDFKYDFKKLIFDYTNDYEYFKTKIKHPSSTIYYSLNSFVATNQKKQRILSKNFSIKDYYIKENFINEWLTS
jgi:hypothetical protein